MTSNPSAKKTFSYEEAQELLPQVIEITRDAVERVELLLSDNDDISQEQVPDEVLEGYNEIIDAWAGAIIDLGADVKGLWLVDFDSGSGYYCWKHPEPALQHFHGYDEGFQGRVKLN